MALFRIKKEDEKGQEAEVAEKKTVAAKKDALSKAPAKKAVTQSAGITSSAYARDLDAVLLNPRVTEKATMEVERGVYVFNVAPRATKFDIADAIKRLYKVTPEKIRIVNYPTKQVRSRSRNTIGTKSGGKKAYIYLKEGDTINIV